MDDGTPVIAVNTGLQYLEQEEGQVHSERDIIHTANFLLTDTHGTVKGLSAHFLHGTDILLFIYLR